MVGLVYGFRVLDSHGTEPKRRSLGTVVALRDRGRKLYPDPGARAGTSEAEADPCNSRGSMD